ncbi:hypothetical protein ISN45_Aa01g026900 [Arabidopsis thaliana x Arabidopsis arenosa]|uniref:Uncharacterized protein n=1 Tax=Arabidopsis thaliana x Arabidopsis arenosa TaxID=1240361 RepID=A0A8T2C7W8_9BRAS|nr:hypothetical protein ISN45_Aa01g026900 [Arabidopsis thaliana x Arabidopsis arenosa]
MSAPEKEASPSPVQQQSGQSSSQVQSQQKSYVGAVENRFPTPSHTFQVEVIDGVSSVEIPEDLIQNSVPLWEDFLEDWESSPRSREGRFHSPYPRRTENDQERFTPNRFSFHQPNPPIQDHSRVPWRQKSHEERLESLMSQYLDQQALDTRTLHARIDKIDSVLSDKIDELSFNFKRKGDQGDQDDIRRIQSKVNGIDESIWRLQTRIMNLESKDEIEDVALEYVIRRQGEVEDNNIKCIEGQSHIRGALRRVSMDSSRKYIELFDKIVELSKKFDDLSSRVTGHDPLESGDEESIPDATCSAANTHMEEPPDELLSKRVCLGTNHHSHYA